MRKLTRDEERLIEIIIIFADAQRCIDKKKVLEEMRRQWLGKDEKC